MDTETEKNPRFAALLDYLRRSRGFNFSSYKGSSLMRRVDKRIQAINVGDYAEYLDYLEVHPEEFTQLFNTILINVTGFFRDESAWDYLAQVIIPRLLEEKAPDEPIRVWSAGCSSGEETYTLAMLLVEALGPEAFRRRVKIYATDLDEEALAQARSAAYTDKDLQVVPASMRKKYFGPLGGRHTFHVDLRRAVIFGRHDLLQDAPISRLDLLICRNTLMYFNAEAQSKILARFHFALREAGVLFLGKAEMLLTHSNLFTPLDLKHRVFVKTAKVSLRDRLLVLAQGGDVEAADHLSQHERLREIALDAGSDAQVAVDHEGRLALANERARALFGLDLKDLGRPLQDLELSYRPAELRSLLDQAYSERRAFTLGSVERRLESGDAQYFDLRVTPLYDNGTRCLGASIIFDDVTVRQRLQMDLQRSTQELETTNEELQSAHEELETTNEELQSTNEELETTNEELQSTNEELETMNEELQSTNEELATINTELRQRGEEIAVTNAFLESILTGLRAAVVVVDRALKILVWNRRAEDLWGLRAEEVRGQPLLGLDIGLPLDQLPLSLFLAGKADHQELTLAGTNRRGKAILCHITITSFLAVEGGRGGVVVLMEEVEG
jgi:two-component system CheB/CheR fusion protein